MASANSTVFLWRGAVITNHNGPTNTVKHGHQKSRPTSSVSALSVCPTQYTNKHHEFEHLARWFVRIRICDNVMLATLPVGAGGDQGRDFETYRTYLATRSVGNASSLRPASIFSRQRESRQSTPMILPNRRLYSNVHLSDERLQTL